MREETLVGDGKRKQGIMMSEEIDEMKREQEYNLLGFRLVRAPLRQVPLAGDDLPMAKEIAESVLRITLANYFEENEGHFLDPDIRKYIIAGGTMAYVYWNNGVKEEFEDSIHE